MRIKNYQTQLNLWLICQVVWYVAIGFGCFVLNDYLPMNFLLGYEAAVILALLLSVYTVRISQYSQRMRSYAALMRYKSKPAIFLFWLLLSAVFGATEYLLDFGGIMSGIFFFTLIREILMTATSAYVNRYPADVPEEMK